MYRSKVFQFIFERPRISVQSWSSSVRPAWRRRESGAGIRLLPRKYLRLGSIAAVAPWTHSRAVKSSSFYDSAATHRIIILVNFSVATDH